MLEIAKIVTVIDPTAEQQPALERACWLAKKTGAELDLLVCYYNEYLSGDRLFDSPSLERARAEVIDNHAQRLESMAEPLRKDGLFVTTSAVWDHPLHEGIIRHAVDVGADVVLKDTHHHTALARALLTNTDWNLIRTCPMPLWLVKPHEIAEAPVFIASIDPMNEHDKPAALDDEILQTGRLISEAVEGKLHALHCYDPRVAVATATANAYIPISLPYDEITQFHGIPKENTHLLAGMTHEELPEHAARLGADVVVMGAVSRNRWKRLFIGATAERTLEFVPCDMLIIKPDWFHTPIDLTAHEAA